MIKNESKVVRNLREIEIFDKNLDKWIKTMGFYPDEWICKRPGCIRVTKGSNRYKSSEEHYCSHNCRGLHFTKRYHRRRRIREKIDKQ